MFIDGSESALRRNDTAFHVSSDGSKGVAREIIRKPVVSISANICKTVIDSTTPRLLNVVCAS